MDKKDKVTLKSKTKALSEMQRIFIRLGTLVLTLVFTFILFVSWALIVTQESSDVSYNCNVPSFIAPHRLLIDNHGEYSIEFSRAGRAELRNIEDDTLRLLSFEVLPGYADILFEVHFESADELVFIFKATNTSGFNVDHAGIVYTTDGDAHTALLTRR